MREPDPRHQTDSILFQYMALAIHGSPILDESRTSSLQGKTVTHRDTSEGDDTGTVVGSAVIDGFVWVFWDQGQQHGLHREAELREVP